MDRRESVGKRLQDERRRLRSMIGYMLGHTSLDNGDLALLEGIEVQLRAADRAADRLAQGTYGLCEACGAAIDPARLEVVPTTALCVGCARAYEQARRARRGAASAAGRGSARGTAHPATCTH